MCPEPVLMFMQSPEQMILIRNASVLFLCSDAPKDDEYSLRATATSNVSNGSPLLKRKVGSIPLKCVSTRYHPLSITVNIVGSFAALFE